MKSILDLLPTETLAIRGGETIKVLSANLVPCNIVKFSVGNKVTTETRLPST